MSKAAVVSAIGLVLFLIGAFLIHDLKIIGGIFLMLWANNISMRLS